MSVLGFLGYLWIQFDAYALGRIQACQKVSEPAADFQNAKAFSDQKLVQPSKVLVVGLVALAEPEH